MSYILEALKKAEAERQLGDTPTLHALPIQAGASARRAARRKHLWLGTGIVAVALAGAAGIFAWRQHPAPAADAPPRARVPEQVAAAPEPLPPARRAEPAGPPPRVAAAVPEVRTRAPLAAPAPLPEPKKVPAAAPPPAEDAFPAMRDMPEAIRRELPQLSFGGYIYSSNPADRLLLIDKVLRHEGEEIAPGLVLEKLQPKAALMNYKGYRYRVPY